MRITKTLGAIFAIGACSVSAAALADGPLGLYIGAGVGESQIRSDDPSYGYPAYYDDYQTAWKALIGFRPIRYVGLEASYIDFGAPGNHRNYDVNVYGEDSHPTAPALFALGYLPVPIPYLDIFAKAGAARLRTNVTFACNSSIQACTTIDPEPAYIREAVTYTKFAYGAGVQSKFPFGLVLRAEYERIASQFGDPDALMVSAIWSF